MKTVALGPDGALLATLSAVPAERRQPYGAVIWGLGLSELLLARRLARFGIPSIQLRIAGDAFTNDDQRNRIYDTRGIDLCRIAMDHLATAQGIGQFLAVGNCATGSLVLNAALVDERIFAVVPTNPHFEGLPRPLRGRLRQLRRREGWRNLLQRLKPPPAPGGGLGDGPGRAGRTGTAAPNVLRARNQYRGDLFIGEDFIDRLRQLQSRGVSVHLACTRFDDSRYILGGRFGRALERLQREGGLSLQTINRDVHVFSEDELAAAELNEGICAWLERISRSEIATRARRPFARIASSPEPL